MRCHSFTLKMEAASFHETSIPSRLHGILHQKTLLFIGTAVRNFVSKCFIFYHCVRRFVCFLTSGMFNAASRQNRFLLMPHKRTAAARIMLHEEKVRAKMFVLQGSRIIGWSSIREQQTEGGRIKRKKLSSAPASCFADRRLDTLLLR